MLRCALAETIGVFRIELTVTFVSLETNQRRDDYVQTASVADNQIQTSVHFHLTDRRDAVESRKFNNPRDCNAHPLGAEHNNFDSAVPASDASINSERPHNNFLLLLLYSKHCFRNV